MELAGRVLAIIRAHDMVPPGGRVLVALSGGADSVGLLHLLLALAADRHLTVAGVAHLNHGLRPAAADDERFCRELAARVGVEAIVEAADVAGLARGWRTSIEDAGRRARYAFLARAAAAAAADRVATGHTEDDQAETFLLQLLRGAGAKGLGSIRPVAGPVCRPLLEVGRAEVREWLEVRGLPSREDESNRDPAFLRNRVRAELLPLLVRRFSPGIVSVLAREAAIARHDEAYLEAAAIEVARSVVLLKDAAGRTWSFGEDAGGAGPVEVVEIESSALMQEPRALASRVARMALGVHAGARFVSSAHVEALLAVAGGGRPASLPGQQAIAVPGRTELRRGRPQAFANSFQVSLSIPGEVLLAEQGWRLSAGWPNPSAADRTGTDGGDDLVAPVRAERLDPPLAVRSRRRGDRFHPPGLGGRSRKLQDYFVDRKVPRDVRDAVPLVVDRSDRIVWVVGQAIAEEFRVTAPSQGVLLLKARRLGGLG